MVELNKQYAFFYNGIKSLANRELWTVTEIIEEKKACYALDRATRRWKSAGAVQSVGSHYIKAECDGKVQWFIQDGDVYSGVADGKYNYFPWYIGNIYDKVPSSLDPKEQNGDYLTWQELIDPANSNEKLQKLSESRLKKAYKEFKNDLEKCSSLTQ